MLFKLLCCQRLTPTEKDNRRWEEVVTANQLCERFVRPALRDILLARTKESDRASRVCLLFTHMNALPGIEPRDVPKRVRGDWSTLRQARSVKPTQLRRVASGSAARAKADSLSFGQHKKVLQAFWNITGWLLDQ